MDVDISAWVLIKASAAVLGTYFILPLVLVGRDFVLWRVIDKFILTEKLRFKVKAYTEFVEQWNNTYTKTASVKPTNGKTEYFIGGHLVTPKEYQSFSDDRDHMSKLLDEYSWYIQKRSNMVSWLLKHYKQDSVNPVPEWLKASSERARIKQVSNAANNSPEEDAGRATPPKDHAQT